MRATGNSPDTSHLRDSPKVRVLAKFGFWNFVKIQLSFGCPQPRLGVHFYPLALMYRLESCRLGLHTGTSQSNYEFLFLFWHLGIGPQIELRYPELKGNPSAASADPRTRGCSLPSFERKRQKRGGLSSSMIWSLPLVRDHANRTSHCKIAWPNIVLLLLRSVQKVGSLPTSVQLAQPSLQTGISGSEPKCEKELTFSNFRKYVASGRGATMRKKLQALVGASNAWV